MIDAKVQSTNFYSTGYIATTNDGNNVDNTSNDFDLIYSLAMPSASDHRRQGQLLDSLAWLEGVPNTPSPLGWDDVDLDWEQPAQSSAQLSSQHPGPRDFVLDPPLFPSPTSLLQSAWASPSNSQSQLSLLSLSPASSTTLDADSLLSFDVAAVPVSAPASEAQGTMSDAEFQLLLDGLSPEDMASMMLPTTQLLCEPAVSLPMSVPMSVPLSMSLPVPAVDNFALHAFPSLDLFDPSMGADMVSTPVSLPASPAEDAATAGSQGSPSFRCRTCHRPYPSRSRLRKHEHTHTRPFACTVCHKAHAAKKDLHRHLWSTHPEAAAAQGIPSPMRVCHVPGCGFESRQDNLTRHIRTKHPDERV
ncbi:hypothetical protein SPBR_06044 [Sporothrix brasiliensis 5110]|uniref:C2H2-type domain-containing protein n=1 Tax=Sporothrix brasiliensis 5110 TaxID=1398154 RepID=A0A0C2J5J3_9PEZI|nr:uncharacterized protein SPBR_06044 [Sporothrix brasiliensis 5110]KIH94260.1 hypothetical protein SPBR_06044 [Sporothrix brasiliensis 5110]